MRQSYIFGAAAALLIGSHSPVLAQQPADAQSPTKPDLIQTVQGDTLLGILGTVYRSNPRLQAERARLREIDETYIQARAQGRFSVTADGQVAGEFINLPSGDATFGTPGGTVSGTPSQAQLQIIQPLYQGGRVKALKSQAKANILAARAGLEDAENSIFLTAANAYVDVIRDEENARIRRSNVRVLTRQLTAANDRFEVGEGTRTDIAQSESRLAVAEAGLAQANAQLEVSRAQFVRVVGRMPNQPGVVPRFSVPSSVDRAIELARNNNPQLVAAQYNELAGEAAIDVAKAAGRPVINLAGSLGAQRDTVLGFTDRSEQGVLAAQIRIPIFSGGINESRVRQAEQARTRLGFETRDAERAIEEAIKLVWAQLEASQLIIATSRRQVDAAEIAFEGVTLEQQVGVRDQLDVLNAEQEVLNARLQLNNAERDYNSAVFQLLSIIGVFDADGIALPVKTYDETLYLLDAADDEYRRVFGRLTENDDFLVPAAEPNAARPEAPIIMKTSPHSLDSVPDDAEDLDIAP